MADKEATEAVKTEAKGSTPLIPLVLAMVVTILGAVGGAMYWLTKSGRLPVQGAAAQAAAVPKPVEVPKSRMMEMLPILVNLADEGGGGYLRVVMVLRVEDAAPPKVEKAKPEKPPEKGKIEVDENESLMRDAAITVLGRETSEQLLALDGKEVAKKDLKAAFAVHAPELKIDDVLFTEFLVQR